MIFIVWYINYNYITIITIWVVKCKHILLGIYYNIIEIVK